MNRVVADTNVLTSAMLFGGLPRRFFQLAEERTLQLASSPDLLEEFEGILRDKFSVPRWERRDLRLRVERCALIVNPSIRLQVVTDDPDDDRVLECAMEAGAEYIVTGDKHLLRLGAYGEILILTVREFFDAGMAG